MEMFKGLPIYVEGSRLYCIESDELLNTYVGLVFVPPLNKRALQALKQLAVASAHRSGSADTSSRPTEPLTQGPDPSKSAVCQGQNNRLVACSITHGAKGHCWGAEEDPLWLCHGTGQVNVYSHR